MFVCLLFVETEFHVSQASYKLTVHSVLWNEMFTKEPKIKHVITKGKVCMDTIGDS